MRSANNSSGRLDARGRQPRQELRHLTRGVELADRHAVAHPRLTEAEQVADEVAPALQADDFGDAHHAAALRP